MEKATFGAGCFWGVESAFRQVEGVTDAAVGFMGGTTANPSYRDVCTGRTGHAEVTQVTFDPARVTYERLLDVFWEIHDPTTLNRQGPDHGTQYRSAIFYHDDRQRAIAEEIIRELNAAAVWPEPIVTEVAPASTFYKAEDYHQEYFQNNPRQPYCAYVVAPKVQKFRQKFASKRRASGNTG
jgi:peptide-methionine (S)-S-oxide reductase